MQQLQNNDLRRIPSEKGKGLAGAVLFHTVLVVILIIVGFSVPLPEPESGILVNFGFDETGSGLIEPSSQASPPAASPAEAVAAVNPNEESLVTQDFDKDVPEVKKVDPEAEKRKQEQIEAEKRKRAEEEAERIKKQREEEERKRIEAEQKRIDEIMSKTKNALAGARNTGTNSGSEGIAGGQGNQGDPEGSPDSKIRGAGGGTGTSGISFDLAGRGSISLPLPRYDYQKEGRVVVDVTVDRTGKVTQAIAGVKGSTTLEDDLLNAAREAALKAQFEPKPDGPVFQKGTITYNFVLK